MSTSLCWRPPAKWHDTGLQGPLKEHLASRRTLTSADLGYLHGLLDASDGETKKIILKLIAEVEHHGEIELSAQ